MNGDVKWVFSTKLMISFRSARKLSNHLGLKSILLRNQLDHLNVSKKRVKVCENVNKTENFASSVTLKT